MARPKKILEERRTKRVEVRLTTGEEKTLSDYAKAAGLTISDFLRKTALGSKPRINKATPERASFIKALAELGRIGSNLNQIVRAINRQQAAGHPVNVPAPVIEKTFTDMQELSNHLIESLTDGHTW